MGYGHKKNKKNNNLKALLFNYPNGYGFAVCVCVTEEGDRKGRII